MGIFTELLKCFLPSNDAFLFMWLLAALGLSAVLLAGERWLSTNKRTDYDAASLFERIKRLIVEKNLDEAFRICASGGHRALPRILGAGIQKAQVEPHLVEGAMGEESTHMAAQMEKRLSLLVMFSNVVHAARACWARCSASSCRLRPWAGPAWRRWKNPRCSQPEFPRQ